MYFFVICSRLLSTSGVLSLLINQRWLCQSVAERSIIDWERSHVTHRHIHTDTQIQNVHAITPAVQNRKDEISQRLLGAALILTCPSAQSTEVICRVRLSELYLTSLINHPPVAFDYLGFWPTILLMSSGFDCTFITKNILKTQLLYSIYDIIEIRSFECMVAD